jgi:hypothetical protein
MPNNAQFSDIPPNPKSMPENIKGIISKIVSVYYGLVIMFHRSPHRKIRTKKIDVTALT